MTKNILENILNSSPPETYDDLEKIGQKIIDYNKHYLLNVDYNCFLKNTDGGFLLFGPIFYQDNEWWGFEYYNDDYYDKSEKQHYYAFMTYFVKRVSLGKDILINK